MSFTRALAGEYQAILAAPDRVVGLADVESSLIRVPQRGWDEHGWTASRGVPQKSG